MARIKTVKYEFDGKDIEVNFNCSTSGLFSTNLHCVIQDKLGLDSRLEYSSLKELEETINNAFRAYKEANTSYKLVIAICFGASGEFIKKPDGEYNEKFYPLQNNPHKISISMSQLKSAVGIDYRVLMEENRDGRISYHKVHHISFNPFNDDLSQKKVIGEYYSVGNTNIWNEEKLIDYSDTAIHNLKSITSQLQRASSFLVELVTSDRIELILSNNNLKALT